MVCSIRADERDEVADQGVPVGVAVDVPSIAQETVQPEAAGLGGVEAADVVGVGGDEDGEIPVAVVLHEHEAEPGLRGEGRASMSASPVMRRSSSTKRDESR